MLRQQRLQVALAAPPANYNLHEMIITHGARPHVNRLVCGLDKR
jgi:hypothetical protein